MPETHVIDVRPDGWTIQHPLACRPLLFACPVNRAAERQLAGPPTDPGQYVCDLAEGGHLLIGRPATNDDLNAGVPAEPIRPVVATARVLAEVMTERQRQDARWGEQNHPDGTGDPDDVRASMVATEVCQAAFDMGQGTWRHVLEEEVAEVFAETDPAKVRAELLQVAAVAAAWVEAIDRRTAGTAS